MIDKQVRPHLMLLQLFGFMLLGGLIAGLITYGYYERNGIDFNIPTHPRTFFFSNILAQVLTFLIPPIIVARINNLNFKDFVTFDKQPLKWWFYTLVIFLGAFIIMQMLGSINSRLIDVFPNSEALINELEHDKFMDTVVSGHGWQIALLAFVVLGLVAPICEEIFFRGFLQGIFLRISNGNKHFSVITTALVFSAMHLQPLKILPMFLLALCLGYLYTETRNLKYPILFHALLNGSQVWLLYFGVDWV